MRNEALPGRVPAGSRIVVLGDEVLKKRERVAGLPPPMWARKGESI